MSEKMNENKFICIMCPLGCEVTVRSDAARNITEVLGNACKKGEAYAREEFSAPKRMLTTTVGVEGGYMGRLPVRTTGFIAKDMQIDCAKEISKVKISKLVKAGDIIIKDLMGLGVDVIATKDLY